ncbi:hypothetical protein Lepto7375DRAFT_0834 [Leptolyngbya sp. PCC 7375]|nr:hypothetical protein Lepto7375DRAFT_0834 [Leptolyngbya sp. PCC 7375]
MPVLELHSCAGQQPILFGKFTRAELIIDELAVKLWTSLKIKSMALAALLASFLTPFLPHLLKLGQPVAEEAGKKLGEKLGEGTWEKAKQVWGKVFPKVNEKPLAKGAAEALAEDTQDKDAQDALTKEFKKLLEANPELAQSLQQLLAEDTEAVAKAVSVTQTVTGDQNIIIGDASGSFTITQD